jgi:small subunit ribosomal protein S6
VRPYETMVIFDPEVEESQVQEVLDRALDVVRTNGGTPGSVDRWGRRTLAYEMNHKREGYYVVAEFSAEPKASAELDRFLVLADEVMRHKIIRLPDKVAARGPRPKGPPQAKAPSGPRSSGGRSGGPRGGTRDGARGAD